MCFEININLELLVGIFPLEENWVGRATSTYLEHLGLAIPEADIPTDLPLTGAIIKSL